jgi:hypothetical protein
LNKKYLLTTSLLAFGLTLTACGTAEKKEETKTEQTEKKQAAHEFKAVAAANTQALSEIKAEMEKAKEGKAVDYDKVKSEYTAKLQSLVQKRDGELSDSLDQQFVTIIDSAKAGTMKPLVATQLFDKLMQKVLYVSMKSELNAIGQDFDKLTKEQAQAHFEEANTYYAALVSTVQKRDAAYGTKVEDSIKAGFTQMSDAINAKEGLSFNLGKQLADKSLMKTFYLAVAATPHGYTTKAFETSKKDAADALVKQSEGWAFYQSIYPYLKKHSEAEAEFIQTSLDLKTDAKTIDPAKVNTAAVKAFLKTAQDELVESEENMDKDKGVITGFEGLLFITVVEGDLKAKIGDVKTQELITAANDYYVAVKDKKDDAKTKFEALEIKLNEVAKNF